MQWANPPAGGCLFWLVHFQAGTNGALLTNFLVHQNMFLKTVETCNRQQQNLISYLTITAQFDSLIRLHSLVGDRHSCWREQSLFARLLDVTCHLTHTRRLLNEFEQCCVSL